MEECKNVQEPANTKITLTIPTDVVEALKEVDRFLVANLFAHSSSKRGVTQAARVAIALGARVLSSHIAVDCARELMVPAGKEKLLALHFEQEDLNALRVYAGLLRDGRLNKVDRRQYLKATTLESAQIALNNGVDAIKQLIEQEKLQESSPLKAKV